MHWTWSLLAGHGHCWPVMVTAGRSGTRSGPEEARQSCALDRSDTSRAQWRSPGRRLKEGKPFPGPHPCVGLWTWAFPPKGSWAHFLIFHSLPRSASGACPLVWTGSPSPAILILSSNNVYIYIYIVWLILLQEMCL